MVFATTKLLGMGHAGSKVANPGLKWWQDPEAQRDRGLKMSSGRMLAAMRKDRAEGKGVVLNDRPRGRSPQRSVEWEEEEPRLEKKKADRMDPDEIWDALENIRDERARPKGHDGLYCEEQEGGSSSGP